ncbi:MAG: hypothetical protein ACTIN1_06540 [Pseudolactococcus laudensis]
MRTSRATIEKLPKIELHCHLDGSISMQTIRQLAQQAGIELPVSDEDLRLKITAPQNAESLMDYLAPFDFVLPMLQTETSLELAAYDILEQAQKDNNPLYGNPLCSNLAYGSWLDAITSGCRGYTRLGSR